MSDSDYSGVIINMYELASDLGKHEPDTAWLEINEVHWPNPHYKGEPICNPDAGPNCKDGQQFNPKIGPSLRERYEAHKKAKNDEKESKQD